MRPWEKLNRRMRGTGLHEIGGSFVTSQYRLVTWVVDNMSPVDYSETQANLADMPDDEFEALVARYKLETSE